MMSLGKAPCLLALLKPMPDVFSLGCLMREVVRDPCVRGYMMIACLHRCTALIC